MSTAHEPHITSQKTYVQVYVALLLLLVLTLGVANVNLDPFNFAASMLIATAKGVLVVTIFMHVRWSERLIWIFAAASFLWLAILIALSLNDYFTRGLLNILGK